ncbi:SRPBCC domain-containing protein [Chitinophaga oryzae]|uniref:SRPBCC domain-containing protein n=1 Tax=Chitinophaga oryzae TaxID=2725414 RepID=A0AAE6ZIS3_9BACT|nr:SRPBCC domain-containing protein [Chitinophaga oryzae]QJB32499.1 SRPBCC domain-containing protein [Chitinophaga oryzae]QJB38971.1 SRPBCC domain-containing protein [Chitinophaga oryzae]
MGPLIISASIHVAKPPQEVFEAIIDPKKMSNYFIASGSGRMEEGETVVWRFAEEDVNYDIPVKKVIKDSEVHFEWEGAPQHRTQVKIALSPSGSGGTVVHVTEGELPLDAKGLKWFSQNTFGWANFLDCLKAYLEYGINLRKGAFDDMQA